MTRYLALATFAFCLAACGGDAQDEPVRPTADAEEQSDAPGTRNPAAPAGSSVQTTISVADIDRWQRGMEAELKAVQDAAAKLAQASDDNAKLEALNAATEMSTTDAGASAAGLDREQYRRVRSTLSGAVSQLSPIEMEMDVSQMPPQMVEQMKQARDAGVQQLTEQLPADVIDALKARAADLRQLDKTLVGERLKVAQAAR